MASDEDYRPPEKKCKRNAPTRPIAKELKCIICNGYLGPLQEGDLARNVSKRGLQTITKVCEELNDEVNIRIGELSEEDRLKIKFHESCRATYTHKERQHLPQASWTSKVSEQKVYGKSTQIPLLRSKVAPFNWQDQCVVCGDKGSVRRPLSFALKDPAGVYKTLKDAATKRKDGKMVLHRLASGDTSQKWRYHRKCYQAFRANRNITSQSGTNNQSRTETQQEHVMTSLIAHLEPALFVEKKVLFLSDVCSRYKAIMEENFAKESTDASMVRSGWLKYKIKEKFRDRVVFYSQRGTPDVFCSGDVAIGVVIRNLQRGEGDLDIMKEEGKHDGHDGQDHDDDDNDGVGDNGSDFVSDDSGGGNGVDSADGGDDAGGDAGGGDNGGGDGSGDVAFTGGKVDGCGGAGGGDSGNDSTDDTHNVLTSEEVRCLHQTARILRDEIEGMEETREYHNVQQVDLNASEQFVPTKLSCLLQMLLDKKAFQSPDKAHDSGIKIRRWYIALAECIVYCSRRGEHQVIPPLHIGLLLQMHHQFGSKNLIETLHGHGFCASYDELRVFLTCAAEKEIDSQTVTDGYVPPGIISRDEGGCVIQEGNDNIDINVQTIDGNNTYHAMARVVFQQQNRTAYQPPSATINRPKSASSQNRSLKVDSKVSRALIKPTPFKKPKKRPHPPTLKDPLQLINKLSRHPIILPRDLSWSLLRQISRNSLCSPQSRLQNLPHSIQTIPMWTGFNSVIEKDNGDFTIASYAPTIEAPPTDMATVYTTLKRGQELASKAGQDYHIHTFDQQLYAIAQQVKWANLEEFSGLVNRLGGFHGMCSFISCIGKMWGDGGLKDMLVDSNVYAPSTADQMLSGRQFHRAVRGLTLCYEALMNRYINAFVEWCFSSDHRKDHQQDLEHLESLLMEVRSTLANGKISEIVTTQLEKYLESELLPLLMAFSEEKSTASHTFKYWFSCLKALQIMLLNIRAERNGDWILHLQSVLSMMPFFFCSNHQNYARWATSYIIDMLTILPAEVETAFMEGQFAVRRTHGSFNAIWSDMGVETTVIRDSKARNSGIIGKTHTETTALRWCLTNLLLGQYTTAMQSRISGSSDSGDTSRHEQMQPAKMKQDEEHACQIIQHITENMTDPFRTENHPDALINIGSGLYASEEVEKSLLAALEKGTKTFQQFVVDRFSEGNEKSFWDAIPKSGLQTFTDMNKTTPIKRGGKRLNVNMSAEYAFRRALAISESREDVKLATVLNRPITSIPTMLFKEDGTKRKTQKAEILHYLEDKVPAVHERPKKLGRCYHCVHSGWDG